MKRKTIQTILTLLGLIGLMYLGMSLGRVVPAAPTATVTAYPASPTSEPQAILDDLRVRQAIAHCTDRSELIRAVYPWLEDTRPFEMDSFLPANHPFYAGNDPEFQRYPYDPEQGRALLESAGWTLPAGAEARVNAEGEELQLTLTTTASNFHKTLIPVLADQLKLCGFHVESNYLLAGGFYDEAGPLDKREFEIAALAQVISAHPEILPFSCNNIPSLANEFIGENYDGWCNTVVEEAIAQTEGRLERDVYQRAVRTIQIESARDLPSLPLFHRMEVSATNAAMQNFIPLPSQVYTWNAAAWSIAGKEVIVIGERSEPAGLHPLDDSYVNAVVRALIDGLDYFQRDYEYQPVTLKRFPTLENGGAFIDSNGQLVVTYEFIEGLTWSDGVPVTREDYQLAYEILCNPESVDEYLSISPRCEQIASVDFTSNTSYTVTYVPDYRDPEYFLPPIGRQPAHRITEDGRPLGEVPASYWTWLVEVNNYPIGIGPYVLQSWEYGKQITFTVNPYYFGKPPVTPTIIIKFIPQDEIESHLLRGIIDIADSTSFWLGELSPAVLQAQSDEKARLYFVPTTIYEQLDFRLTVR